MSSFRADIQGLRAIAVLLVVVYHAGFERVSGGYIGVDVFFVISGYLITGLLVRELNETGSVDLASFYARRIRRLLPAATLVLVAVIIVALTVYSPLEIRDFSFSAFATATYSSNFLFAYLTTDYLAENTNFNPLLHTWSLSVEEQFYLVWPTLLILLARTVNPSAIQIRLRTGLLVLCSISLAFCTYLTVYNQPWAFFSSPTRAWEFGIGGIIALSSPTKLIFRERIAFLMGSFGMLLIGLSAMLFDEQTNFPGLYAVIPVVGASLVIAAASDSRPVGVSRLLSSAPLVFLGDISYSIYLWHWPIFVYMGLMIDDISDVERLAGIVTTLVLAWITYVFIENRFRLRKMVTNRAGVSIAIGLLLSGATAVLSFTILSIVTSDYTNAIQLRYMAAPRDRPTVNYNGCHATFLETKPKECLFGHKNSSFKVVLFGDSHAAQWFPALLEIADNNGWALISMTKTGCPSVEYLPYSRKFKRPYTECETWREQAINRISAVKPAIVVLSNFNGYLFSAGLDVNDPHLATKWAHSVQSTVSKLAAMANAVVLIRDTPSLPFNAPKCLSRAEWQGEDSTVACGFKKSDSQDLLIFDAELAEIAKLSNTYMIDMTSAICQSIPCELERDGIILYRDDHHLTAGYSRHLSDQLQLLLQPALKQSK